MSFEQQRNEATKLKPDAWSESDLNLNNAVQTANLRSSSLTKNVDGGGSVMAVANTNLRVGNPLETSASVGLY